MEEEVSMRQDKEDFFALNTKLQSIWNNKQNDMTSGKVSQLHSRLLKWEVGSPTFSCEGKRVYSADFGYRAKFPPAEGDDGKAEKEKTVREMLLIRLNSIQLSNV